MLIFFHDEKNIFNNKNISHMGKKSTLKIIKSAILFAIRDIQLTFEIQSHYLSNKFSCFTYFI